MSILRIMCDLETTGLSPLRNQVVEIGAVLVVDGVVHYGTNFHCYVDHDVLCYDLEALKKFGTRLDNRHPDVRVLDREQAWLQLVTWSRTITNESKPTWGGKNFSNFDAPFLDALSEGRFKDHYCKHRIVDLGSKYEDPKFDKVLPDLETCRKRALKCGVQGTYIQKPVTHTALDDAAVCAELYVGWADGLLGNPANPAWR